MKTIKSLKDIATLELGDKVVFGDLEYEVDYEDGYFLDTPNNNNDKIFIDLDIDKKDFVKNLGITTLPVDWNFPEVQSLEALTAIVSALFKEYEKQNELPKTWEEFCNRNEITCKESYIGVNSEVTELRSCIRNSIADRNICTSKQEAEAFLALMQLRQLRKCYIGNWEPNWTDGATIKYCISLRDGFLEIQSWQRVAQNLSFPSYELAKQFLTNFNNLIETAKSVLW